MRRAFSLVAAVCLLAGGATTASTVIVAGPAMAAGSTIPTPAILTGTSVGATQSVGAIAANADGSVLVAGYNDARGFPATGAPDSLSGLARSTDGGATWSTPNEGANGLDVLPSVPNGSLYGDPSIVYNPITDRFVYSSIYVRPSDGLQGVAVSRASGSTGTNWSTPLEVTPTFVTGHAADRPTVAVNSKTGRIMVTWTDFGSTSVAIRSTFTDDDGATWSAAQTLTSTATDVVQAPVAAFLPAATNAASSVYVVWRSGTATTRNVTGSRSTDGGATWAAPVSVDSVSYSVEDLIPGIDRAFSDPSIGIDYTSGRVYVAYQRNSSQGTGDIALRTFTGAVQAGTPLLLDANPGNDGAQFLPTVSVDQTTHRVHVAWYDQDATGTSGDLTELMHSSSLDGGVTWSPPTPLTVRPFHAGYGNDTGAPNIGDYLGSTVINSTFHVAHGETAIQPQFDEGLPASSLLSPDMYDAHIADGDQRAPLRVGAITATDTGPGTPNGKLDAGETATISLPLTNYVTNSTVGAATVTGITGTLSSLTTGVTVTQASSSYADVAAGATSGNATPYAITLGAGFVAGTPIDLRLDVTSAAGIAARVFRLRSGTPGTPTTLIDENFEAVTVPALPTGWVAQTGGGAADPWVTTSSFLGMASKAAFHDNDGTATEWMRLFSPTVAVPGVAAGAQSYVTLDFDLDYQLEDDPSKLVAALDGMTVRLTDMTGGTTLRSVLAEAFAESVTTGAKSGFGKHLPRFNNANYLQDMSVWSGDSGGVVHVAMRFPGNGLAGRNVQLRFEYTEDASGTCTTAGMSGPCGIAVDNVKLQQVTYPSATTTALVASPASPVAHGTQTTLTATVSPASAGTVHFFDGATDISGAVAVNAGTAQMMLTPSDGSHDYTAQFVPSAGDVLGSTSTAVPFLVDAVAPAVQITQHPGDPSNTRAVHFAFTGSDAGSPPVTFTCQLDSGSVSACANTVDYAGVADGSHTFTVVGTDGVGNTNNASFTWHVDATAPTVQITSRPPSSTANASDHFTFTASDTAGAVTTTCALDGAAPVSCTSSFDATGLTDGSHSLTVTATDAAGNVGNDSASWTVDTVGPTVQLTEHPAAVTNVAAAHFAFGSSESATFTCVVDGASANGCGTPFDVPSLGDGIHQLDLHATDAAGNVGTASYTWRVDTAPPSVALKSPTAPFVLGGSVTVSWSGADTGSGVASYELQTRRAAWNGTFGPWTTPSSWRALTSGAVSAGLAPGYTTCWRVRAVDAASNTSGFSAPRCAARPLDDRALSSSLGWARKSASGYFLGTFSVSSTKGATLTRKGAQLAQLAVVATTCSTCGVVAVIVSGRQVAKWDLHSARTKRQVLFTLRLTQRTATVALRVLSSGRSVQIDGLGISLA